MSADDVRPGHDAEDGAPAQEYVHLPICCPRCGSIRLHWTLHRTATTTQGSDRFFAWACHACGAEWFEPIVFGMEPSN